MNIPVTSIHGIGPVKAEVLRSEAGIETVEDLLYYIPRKYLDRSQIKQIIDCASEEEVTVAGYVVSASIVRRKKAFLQVEVSDGTDSIYAVFFGAAGFLQKLFHEGEFVLLSGRVNVLRKKQIIHPDFDFIDQDYEIKSINTGRIIPLYKSTHNLKKNGFDSRGFRKVIRSAIEEFMPYFQETLSESLVERNSLIKLNDALKGIHFPDSMEHAEKSRERLAFNEIFFFQYYIQLLKKINRTQLSLPRQHAGDIIRKFTDSLKFKLTGDQQKAINEIQNDLNSPYPMNRLLQGDVGSGKTVVALAGALITINRGMQTAMMVPTEILALQHYETACKLLPDNIRIVLVTGSVSQKDRKNIHEMISNGEADLVIGTHALIQSAVKFHKLGYIIIDEQHRFGVEQRGRLRTKGETPDLLVMTATPIPRSLSMTLYGDLDVSYIKEKPSGRMPVKTLAFPVSRLNGVYNSMRNYLNQGRQIFYILPLIEESEKIDLKSAVETYNHLKDNIFKDMSVALLHGKTPRKDKDEIMLRFRNRDIQILVSTTVIEVGIDIPNASVMVIEHSERFGLSQLHQLRGRVGRGEHQSFCILIHPEKISADAGERIRILTESDDGFDISEKDLQLRGSGQLVGTRQHGFTDFEFTDPASDLNLIIKAKDEAEKAIQDLTDLFEELGNIQNKRFSRQLKGIRHKRILSLLS